MAYAAVISLMNTIDSVRSPSRSFSFDAGPCLNIIGPAYVELVSMQEILKILDCSSKHGSRKEVKALDAEIREVVWRFEDKLESHLSNQFLLQCEESNNGTVDLQDLRHDVRSFVEMTRRMEVEYVDRLTSMPAEEDGDEVMSSRICFSGSKPSGKMVGFSDLFNLIKDGIVSDHRFYTLAIAGMAGVGKTTLVNELFNDKMVLSYFDCRAWVKVGRKFLLNEIARDILAQSECPVTDEELKENGIAFYFKEMFKIKKRCLIVLDDVWDECIWDYLENYFPDDGRSLTLLMTRLREVAKYHAATTEMRFLSKEESWDLLREKVFGEELCPFKLEKSGKKIAEMCEGLPLLIVRVADLLSEAEKTPEYWNMVAEKQNAVFADAYDHILEVIHPSYEYLPQHLKACFLYMGAFPQTYEIPRSKLINMWIGERTFLDPSELEKSEYHAVNYLNGLISNSLVIVRQASCFWFNGKADRVKTFKLHSAFWHLANKVARMNNFFRVLSSRFDVTEKNMKFRRCLCIHNNILFAIKDFYKSVESDCASTVRSLLCFGPYHQYPVPVYVNLRMLRVLDAVNIRFYEFPLKVLKLAQLRYLALTYDGDLPASVSKLCNLQFLIIHRHTCIRSWGAFAYSYVPVEIWDMQELKHIEVVGSNLPDSNCRASLKKLSTLLGVSAYSCTKSVLKRISKLKRIGIRIELMPDDNSNKVFYCLNRIGTLRKLESLKCVVVNPEMRSGAVPLPQPRSMFPSGLRKLTLSGLGYPWEYMSIIAKLEKLSELKLQNYAFQGPMWEVKESEPLNVGFLLIEDTDLLEWKVAPGGLPCIRQLRIKHCYNFEELNWEPDNDVIRKIEVVECNPSLVARVNQIEAAQLARQYPHLDVSLYSSWDDRNLQSTQSPYEWKLSFWEKFPASNWNAMD